MSRMKIKKNLSTCLLVSICFLLSSVTAFGQETKLVPEHAFEIGLNLGYFNYEEDFGTADPEWDGFMYGVIGSYTYHNKMMLHASLEYTQGNIDYDGETQDGTPYKEDGDDWILECRVLLGPDFTPNGHLITPFIGIGYRYWNDDIGGPGGYEREVQYWYSPIGIKTVSALSDMWTWGMSAEYDYFLGGKVKSHLSDVASGLSDPEVDQDSGDGYGLRFSLRFSRAFEGSSSLSIEPYISYWDIDESDTEVLTLNGSPYALVVEPENETTSYGVRISWRFQLQVETKCKEKIVPLKIN